MMTPQQIKAERERIEREIEFYRAANRWFEQRRKRKPRKETT